MRTLLTPTRVLVVLALVLALGGTAAAATGLINGSQIKNGTITANKLKNGTVTAGKIKNGTLTKNKFARGVLTAGTRGATGAAGPQGHQGAGGPQGVAGPPGPATAVRYIHSSSGVGPFAGSNVAHSVITLPNVAPGTYEFHAWVNLKATGASASACDIPGFSQLSRQYLPANQFGENTVDAAGTVTTTTSISLACTVFSASWQPEDTYLSATRVSSVTAG
jgi:hypothetical protein